MIKLENVRADLIAIICDGNKVNTSFVRCFDTVQPRRTTDGNFLLYDLVHIVKISGTTELQKKNAINKSL